MCEGLLRLTVDRIFPAPQSSTLNVDADDGRPDSDTPERIGLPEMGSGSEVQANQAPRFGKWKPITMTTRSASKKESSETLSSSLDGAPSLDACVGVRNPSAQLFSLRGRHLTKRSLARAERGVREATAVKVLTAWWRSTAEECRKIRSRKLCAIAEINKWVVKLIARRRRLRANSEQSARVIQALWRRASARMWETRSLVTACVVVQTMWRHWQLNHRCNSRRIRRKVSSGFQNWARVVLSRRQKAGKTILRAVIAATTRQKGKRQAAAVIVRGLEMACNRRRKSRLQLQRFARMPCLLQVRLAALCFARVARVQNMAATIVARAVRRAVARSAIVRVTFAVRTLQFWSRRVRRRWKQRYASAVMLQQAWRRAKQRGIWATAKLTCMADVLSRRDFSRAVAEESPLKDTATAVAAEVSTANAPVCTVAMGKLALDGHQHGSIPVGVAILDLSGSGNLGKLIPSNQVNGATREGNSQYFRSSTPTYSTAEEHVTHSLPVPVDGQYGTSLVFSDELLSPATTTREDWTDPDLCVADGGAKTYHSHASGDSVLSHNEGHCRTMVTARGSASYSGTTSSQRNNGCHAGVEDGQRPRRSTPRTVGPKKGTLLATHERSGGILSLEDILPDFKRRRQTTLLEGKRCGRSEVLHQYKQSNRVRHHRTKRANESQGLGDARATTAFHSCDKGFPYPPAGGAQPINTRAPCTRRRTRTHRAQGKADAGIKPSHAISGINHRGKVGGRIDCAPPPFSYGCRTTPQGDDAHKPSIGRNGTPTVKTSGTPSAKSHSRTGPSTSSRSASAKENYTKIGVGVQGVRHSSTMLRSRGGSSIRFKGGGGVLEMLAFMEA